MSIIHTLLAFILYIEMHEAIELVHGKLNFTQFAWCKTTSLYEDLRRRKNSYWIRLRKLDEKSLVKKGI